jgi:hypothetical protein
VKKRKQPKKKPKWFSAKEAKAKILKGELHAIDVSEVRKGPIIRKALRPELEERVRKFILLLAEVNSMSYEDYIDGFLRDLHPEQEVSLWEAMAAAYQAAVAKQARTIDERQEIFRLILSATSGQSIAYPEHLTQQEADEILVVLKTEWSKRKDRYEGN